MQEFSQIIVLPAPAAPSNLEFGKSWPSKSLTSYEVLMKTSLFDPQQQMNLCWPGPSSGVSCHITLHTFLQEQLLIKTRRLLPYQQQLCPELKRSQPWVTHMQTPTFLPSMAIHEYSNHGLRLIWSRISLLSEKSTNISKNHPNFAKIRKPTFECYFHFQTKQQISCRLGLCLLPTHNEEKDILERSSCLVHCIQCRTSPHTTNLETKWTKYWLLVNHIYHPKLHTFTTFTTYRYNSHPALHFFFFFKQITKF